MYRASVEGSVGSVSSATHQVYTRIEDLPRAPMVVSVGAFDGVHRGHQHLIGQARERADALHARLVIVTFEPLPIQLFRPDSFMGRILTPERRRSLLKHYGADVVVELPFDVPMSRVTAGEFMERLQAVGPVRELWVGNDFALGYKREGTPDRLRELTRDHGTHVQVVSRISTGSEEVSSTHIRQLIAAGRAADASAMMGHRFQVRGIVERGAQIGRQIGFPTANVAPAHDLVQLRDGIYASFAGVEGRGELIPAMTYIGTRPAVNTGQRMIETHLFDVDEDLYGCRLVTEFVRFMRPDQDFPSLDELVQQLRRDEKNARLVLDGESPGI